MLSPDPLEPALQRWFQQEWQAARLGSAEWSDEFAECCPIPWLLPQLLELIVRTHDKPISAVRDEIRHLIMEQDFNDLAGDRVVDDRHRNSISHTVDRLTRTVEQVRYRARAAGRWSAVEPAHYFG